MLSKVMSTAEFMLALLMPECSAIVSTSSEGSSVAELPTVSAETCPSMSTLADALSVSPVTLPSLPIVIADAEPPSAASDRAREEIYPKMLTSAAESRRNLSTAPDLRTSIFGSSAEEAAPPDTVMSPTRPAAVTSAEDSSAIAPTSAPGVMETAAPRAELSARICAISALTPATSSAFSVSVMSETFESVMFNEHSDCTVQGPYMLTPSKVTALPDAPISQDRLSVKVASAKRTSPSGMAMFSLPFATVPSLISTCAPSEAILRAYPLRSRVCPRRSNVHDEESVTPSVPPMPSMSSAVTT